MACCSHKGGGQNAPRQSNAGRTSYSGAAANAPRQSNAGRTPYPRAVARPSQTNAGATPRYSSASKIGKPASRKRIELHVFQENDEGEGEWEPLDQNPPSRRPEQEMAREYMQAMTPGPYSPCPAKEGYQSSNLMNFPDTPTRQPYYQEDNGENYYTPDFAEEEWEDDRRDYTSSGNYELPPSSPGEYGLMPQNPSFWREMRNVMRADLNAPNMSPNFAFNNREDGLCVPTCLTPSRRYDTDGYDMPQVRPTRLDFGAVTEDETEVQDGPPRFQLGNNISRRISDLNFAPRTSGTCNRVRR